ncbi:hypothetical protein [Candidatus Frankia alpina]|uniref:hypothetical protein n=1 Tax=Candidatus Frankia alpina TaxID=2699483 RepID=UPI001F25E62D|nr:hypothetical protein [Candidatus Frankia alpina]
MLLYAIAIAAGLAATLSCAWAARRLGRARGRWLIWLSSALTAWTVGQTAWTLHRWDRLATVRPMVADVGYLADAGQLAMPVLALAALAAVPASRARRSRLRSPLRATTTPAGELGGMGRLAGGGATESPRSRPAVRRATCHRPRRDHSRRLAVPAHLVGAPGRPRRG